MRFPFFLALVLTVGTTNAQQLISAADQSPVPYATAAVLHTELGTVADGEGNLMLPNASPGDTVLLSAMGFASRRMLFGELSGRDTVQLAPQAFALSTINVAAGELTRQRSFGSLPQSNKIICMFLHGRRGEQIGRVLKLKRESVAKTVRVSVVESDAENVRCRIRFYPFAGDTASLTPLEHEDIFFTINEGKKIYEVDLSGRGITLPERVVVAVELVSPPVQKQYIYFGGALFSTRALYRAHGAAPWREGSTSKSSKKKGLAVAAGIELTVLQ